MAERRHRPVEPESQAEPPAEPRDRRSPSFGDSFAAWPQGRTHCSNRGAWPAARQRGPSLAGAEADAVYSGTDIVPLVSQTTRSPSR